MFQDVQPTLKSSATIIIIPTPKDPPKETKDVPKEPASEQVKEKTTTVRPRVSIKKKVSPPKTTEEKLVADKEEETKVRGE